MLEDLNETCGLLVTERPPTEQLAEKVGMVDRIGTAATKDLFKESGLLVIADLGEDTSESHARDILKRAYASLEAAIRDSEPPVVTLPQ